MNVVRYFGGQERKPEGFLKYPNCCDQTEVCPVCGGEGLVGSGMQQMT